MQKECLYCGKDLQYQRNTRKYCNDNCKQLAYYKRKGVSLTGIANDNSGITIKQETVIVKPANAKEDDFTINDKQEQQSITVNDFNPNESDKNIVKATITVKAEEKNLAVKNVLPEEPLYEWEDSELLAKIKDWIFGERKTQEMFEYPYNYWRGDALSIVQWVTMGLRCLIESMIQLSNQSHIDTHTLFEVADAFNRLAGSYCYEFLPSNYPYLNLIKELQQKMNAMAHANKQNDKVRFRVTLERKAKLIATRFIIAGFAPKIKFSELEFPVR